MRISHIQARIRRKRYNYIKVKTEQVGQNLLNRMFQATHKNEKWCTDVTEFKIEGQKKKLYLSAILDLYDRSIVAYVLSNRNDNQLVFRTFDEAFKSNPDAHPLFHSDRGFQYTSRAFKAKLDNAKMIQSMSRVGKCIDNGPMEGFWGTLKSEMFYGYHWKSEELLRKKIKEYIDFYNTRRLQEKLNGLAPMDFRNQAT